MYLSIKQNSIFVADSHFNEKNRELLTFLEKIESKEIITSQLFLMGDMFEFITQESHYFVEQNQEVITLLNDYQMKLKLFI